MLAYLGYFFDIRCRFLAGDPTSSRAPKESKTTVINFVFGSRFEPTTEPLCKAMDCRYSSVTLR